MRSQTHTKTIRRLPPSTYYTNGSSDWKRVVVEIVHTDENIINRINDSASVLDAEMTVIHIAIEETNGPKLPSTQTPGQCRNGKLE